MLTRHGRTLRHSTHRLLFPRKGWRRRVTYLSKRVMRLSATPHSVARGFAVGAFFAFSPLLGLHALLAAALTVLLRGNIVAALIGTAICNPLTLPVILGADYEFGHLLLTGARPEGDTGSMTTEAFGSVWPVIAPIMVGSIVLGSIAAAVGYLGVFGAVKSFQDQRRHRLAEMRR